MIEKTPTPSQKSAPPHEHARAMILLKRMESALARIEGWLVVLFLGLMVTLTFLQVVFRALFTHFHLLWANNLMGAIDWSEPFVRLLVLWLTFLGASLLTRENKHIKIDLMSELFPPGWQPFREMVLSAACVLVLFLALKASISYILVEMDYGNSMFLGLPNWIAQIIIPIGFLTILLRFALRGLDQALTYYRGSRP